ncbi:MAG: glycosyltransferase family 9 protein [candidate division Zixibacteria bacterium]|nr:glycosyltransferase family 9 protein [candidate division Zixibacteria bacterium]
MPPKLIKESEFLFKRFLLSVFRVFLKRGDPSVWPVAPESVKSVLFLRPDKLGDMIASIPAMHALKKRFPHIRIEVIASPHNRALVDCDPAIDTVHVYAKNIYHDLPLIRRLRKKGFDIVFDPISLDSVTGLLLTKFIGKRAVRAGSRKQNLFRYYDYCERHDPDGRDHNYDNSLLIFNVLGIDPATVDPFLPVFLPEDSIARAEQFYNELSCDRRFLIGVNISAGSPTRTLPISKYIAMLRTIGEEHSSELFLISCTAEDRPRGKELVANLQGRARLVPEGLSLLDVSAILRRVDIFISPDTSLVHIVRLMQIPVVGLYSGHIRNYHFWKPYRQEHGSVVAKNIHNLHDIEPDQVVAEFRKVLDNIRKSDPNRIPNPLTKG